MAHHGAVPPPAVEPATVVASLVGRLRAAGCVFAEREAALLIDAEPDLERRESLIARRVAGEPLEYVVGWAEFQGQRFAISRGVFVPRHRSELLVIEAAGRAPRRDRLTVCDLGCGTGALGLKVARLLRDREPAPQVDLHLTDIDEAAAACAVANARVVTDAVGGIAASSYRGDLTQPLPTGLRADVIVAHVPYVPTDRIALMPPEARDHELTATLDGGTDGLDPMRRLAQDVAGGARLAADGVLLAECGATQAAAARRVLEAVGLRVEIVNEPATDDWDGADGATVMVACHAGRHEH